MERTSEPEVLYYFRSVVICANRNRQTLYTLAYGTLPRPYSQLALNFSTSAARGSKYVYALCETRDPSRRRWRFDGTTERERERERLRLRNLVRRLNCRSSSFANLAISPSPIAHSHGWRETWKERIAGQDTRQQQDFHNMALSTT